jgi:hypothetical protein
MAVGGTDGQLRKPVWLIVIARAAGRGRRILSSGKGCGDSAAQGGRQLCSIVDDPFHARADGIDADIQRVTGQLNAVLHLDDAVDLRSGQRPSSPGHRARKGRREELDLDRLGTAVRSPIRSSMSATSTWTPGTLTPISSATAGGHLLGGGCGSASAGRNSRRDSSGPDRHRGRCRAAREGQHSGLARSSWSI